MSSHPVAFVDESFLHNPKHPGVYLVTAVLVDSDEVPTIIDAARAAAGAHPEFHATDLYRRGHITPIEDMLTAVEAHAGWVTAVTQLPIGDDKERARQNTLTRLLRQLDEQKVRDVVLDTRASPREQLDTQLQGRTINRTDMPDVTTYRQLVRNNDISPRMRIMHVDDRRQPALWMPDAAAWALQRALIYDEPQWWNHIAGVASIQDAATGAGLTLNGSRVALPTGERDPRDLNQSVHIPLPPRPVYTLNGGTTNRTHGPGQLYQDLLHQTTTAASPSPSQPFAQQLTALAHSITDLAWSIHEASRPGKEPAIHHGEPITVASSAHADPALDEGPVDFEPEVE